MKINPITLTLKNEVATDLLVRPIIDCTQDTTCNTYWRLLDETGKQLRDGNEPLNEEEYANWGRDNAYVEDIVLSRLGLTRLTVETNP